MPNPENLRKITSEQAREMGKKSKRGPSIKTLLKKFLEKSLDETGVTEEEKVALALIAKARSGDVQAINTLFDRLEGKPSQTIDQNNTNTTKEEVTVKFE